MFCVILVDLGFVYEAWLMDSKFLSSLGAPNHGCGQRVSCFLWSSKVLTMHSTAKNIPCELRVSYIPVISKRKKVIELRNKIRGATAPESYDI